jgi:DNA-binding beta-propeller fold protein YncE
MASGLVASLIASYGSVAQGAVHVDAWGKNGGPTFIPTGQTITATAATGSKYQRLATGLRKDGNADADDAVSESLSPDGKTLLVLTSGFNNSFYHQGPGYVPFLFAQLDPTTGQPSSTMLNQAEWVFVYNVTSGTPKKVQEIPIPNTYEGLVWDPSGNGFYVSGGVDDRILVFWSVPSNPLSSRYQPNGPFVVLNHNSNDSNPIPNHDGGLLAHTIAGQAVPALVTGAIAGGMDVSKDGKTMVVANYGNASASIVNLQSRTVSNEVVFYTPGSATAQGEYPFWVQVVSSPSNGSYVKAYVTSQRDNQVMVISGTSVSSVIPVPSGPNKMVLNASQSVLYVACGNDDSIVAINTATDTIMYTISLARAGYPYKGSWPDDIALSPDGQTMYVSLGGENAIAVVSLAYRNVLGRIPVGWYPTSVRVSANGKYLWSINEKSNVGPNPGQTYYSWNTPYGIGLNKTSTDTYTWEGEKAGIVSMPVPDYNQLSYLSNQVDANNGFGTPNDSSEMAFLRTVITHVIYIVNENRTFDQVLGDLGNGSNGDPKLTFFTQPITPNLHALAADYATLDNFYDSSETSGVGWNWVMQGHTNAFVEQTQPVDYGNSDGYGFTYDWQGIVKHINLGLPATGGNSIFNTRITGLLDPTGSSTILPGYADPSATEGADNLSYGTLGGYIWEDALRKGLSVRNYGWNDDLTYYGSNTPFNPPLVRNPFNTGTLQSAPSTPSIQPVTDLYYRAFDMQYPDIWRIEEWQREYNNFVTNGNMPNLMVMTIPHDHTGSFGSALEGLSTPQLELADHDYAIGQLVQTVSNGPYWGSTAIVMLEDDPQDGQDHVEAHRSIIHIISPYTKSHSVIHTTYTSVNAVRTVEDLLGLQPMGMNDANSAPMSDVFTTSPNLQTYQAIIPGSLCAQPVSPDLVPACSNPNKKKTRPVHQLHNGKWWTRMTAGMDFHDPDHLDAARYNALLELGITGRGTLPPARPKALAVVPGSDD